MKKHVLELVFKCEEFKNHGFGLIFIFTSGKTAPKTIFFWIQIENSPKTCFFIFFSIIEKQLKNVFFEFTLKNWFSGLKMYHSDTLLDCFSIWIQKSHFGYVFQIWRIEKSRCWAFFHFYFWKKQLQKWLFWIKIEKQSKTVFFQFFKFEKHLQNDFYEFKLENSPKTCFFKNSNLKNSSKNVFFLFSQIEKAAQKRVFRIFV